MSITAVVVGLLEAIELATKLIKKVNTGEMTPAEAEAEWKKVSTGWSSAVDDWNRTVNLDDKDIPF